MNSSTDDRPWVTTKEIVQLAGVHPNTVAMWRATGKIVSEDKIGASLLYNKAKVLAFLASRKERKDKNG